MVLDNADDLDMFFSSSISTTADSESTSPLLDYLPRSSRGFMLITSRDESLAKRFAGTRASVVVNLMSPAEAQELLESRQDKDRGSSDRDQSEDLFEALGYLPLAIAQAAAYIDENHITISQYLKMFDTSDSELQDLLSEGLGDLRRDSQSHNSIIKTWKLSFDLICKQKPLAAEILSLMAVLDRQGISESLLRDASDREIDFRTALGTLISFSLIKAEMNGAGYGLHRLVQLAIQKWLEIQNTIGNWQKKALVVVANSFPFSGFETWTTCEALLPHALKVLQYEDAGKSCPEKYSSLSYNVGKFDFDQGRYEKACTKFSAVISVGKEHFAPDHPTILPSISHLGASYTQLGRHEEAEELLVKVVKYMKRVLGAEHLDTIININLLAGLFHGQGRLEEAEKLQVESIEDLKRLQGPEHRTT